MTKTNKAELIVENKLQIIVKESGLEATKAKYILEKFQDYFEIAAEWEKKAKSLVVTNENQKAEMQMARTGRLFLREKRIAIENARKELKEQALREGKAIDGIANVLKALIVPIEEYLERQEKFIEIKEQVRLEAERLEAEKKAEEERIAKEKAYAEELEQKRLENEKLKKEAEKREKALRQEQEKREAEKLKQEKALREQKEKAEMERREVEKKARMEQEETERKAKVEQEKIKREAEKKLEKEREERKKVELELKAKKEAEEKAKEEEQERIEIQKRGSDKNKLLLLADNINAIQLPKVESNKAKKIISQVDSLLKEAVSIIKQ